MIIIIRIPIIMAHPGSCGLGVVPT